MPPHDDEMSSRRGGGVKHEERRVKTKLTTETIYARDEQEFADLIDRAIDDGFDLVEQDEQLAIVERTESVDGRRHVVIRRIKIADSSNPKAKG